jgi:hypothetical protein
MRTITGQSPQMDSLLCRDSTPRSASRHRHDANHGTESNNRFTMNPTTIITLALVLRFACHLIAVILRTL